MLLGNKKHLVVAIDHFKQWTEVKIMMHKTSQSLMNFDDWENFNETQVTLRIQTDCGRPYESTGINKFFAKFNIVYKVSAPYHPESNGTPEPLIRSLEDRLHHINKDQGLIYIGTWTYKWVSIKWYLTELLSFSPFVLLYKLEAITLYRILFTRYASEELYQLALCSCIEKYLKSIKELSLVTANPSWKWKRPLTQIK